ncbi:YdcF family protein [Bacillus sp. DNRA2]|uniref:YdcF family protein n=1 Tax=Bacillus sp. DNRA2 TaxID=2723053 RepID=UPI00145FA192|nr:YdcF family protein [Bacillus sp. DNRA2]NMD71098.1 YdcF family protein [Bacillus sp. DNRA2]
MLIIIISLILLYIGYLQVNMLRYSFAKPDKNADYIIILGARVHGTSPSLTLQERINTASNYLKKNKTTIAIASGGQGPDEEISEAECIKRELMKQGIYESRIILEDRSTDTYENLNFSKKLLPIHAKIGLIVTNDFHIYRSIQIAKDYHLQVSGLPAKTPLIAIPKSYSREYLALTKYFLINILDS